MKNGLKVERERFGITEKNKSNHWIRVSLLAIVAIGLIIAITVKIQNSIQTSINSLSVTNDLNAAWISSMASYWGGIIGGIISGMLAVIGVAWTIRYYRNSDARKSCAEHMPFLKAEVDEKFTQTSKMDNSLKIYNIYHSPKENNKPKGNTVLLNVNLENIGRGFANTLVVRTEENVGGIAFNEVIKINESKRICLEVHEDEEYIKFAIMYIDCMTNEYEQVYTIYLGKKIDIDNGYPKFIGQTHVIGEK